MPLTVEQKDIIKKMMKNLDNNQVQTLGGYAGTGKSTVIKVLLQALHQKKLSFCACAYTGKATNVLRKKGMHADTIHGTIYQPYTDEDGETRWSVAPKAKLFDDGVDGFIVDEASMVSSEIHQDLMSFGLPIIYVGDHGQLEPIGSNANLMKNPMYKLEQVHRNAGEIAHFANHLRQGLPASQFKGATKVQIVKNSTIQDRHLASVDQIICAFNKTRVQLNEKVRIYKKLQYTYLSVGERVICLRNNRKEGLFNGMQGIVQKVHKNERFDFISDDKFYENVHFDEDIFGQESVKIDFGKQANPFDYAYAITAHKAQGDEWNNVIVYEQKCDKWDHVRWAYTAASRAKSGLIWVGVEEFHPWYLQDAA
jgi:exodeoxyribonuclease V